MTFAAPPFGASVMGRMDPILDVVADLLSDGETFYAPTVERGAVALLPLKFDDGDTFHAPLLSGLITITQASSFAATPTFYAHIVRPANLFASSFEDGDAFYTPLVAALLEPVLFADGDTFYGPEVSSEAFVEPEPVTFFASFYQPRIFSVNPSRVICACARGQEDEMRPLLDRVYRVRKY